MSRRTSHYTIGTARHDLPTARDTPSILVSFALAAIIPVALVAASYPVYSAAIAVGLAAAALLWHAVAVAVRRLADEHAHLHVPGFDVDVAFSRAR